MIKVLQVGCGKMSKYLMRYVYEKGATIVGAVDIDNKIIGKDIGFVMDSEDKNIIIQSVRRLDTIIEQEKPDIAIISTMSLLNDIRDVLRILASKGINVITTCEEAFFGINSNPFTYKEIDVLAKANNCTIVGSGYQDVFWGNLVSIIAGTTHRIDKIKGNSSYNIEDYGLALAEAHGAGLTLKEFSKKIAKANNISDEERQKLINDKEFLPSYMWNTIGWIADNLGLNIISMEQKSIPITEEKDLSSDTLNMVIRKGYVTGMSALVTAETEEGITLEAECIGKVYTETDFDINEWSILGEPDTTVTIKRPATVELTCANIVNRIPDVINAPSGFISTSSMNPPTYKSKSLYEYLKNSLS